MVGGATGADELRDEQRVTPGPLVKVVGYGPPRRLAEHARGQLVGLGSGEPGQLDTVDTTHPRQLGEVRTQRVALAQGVGAVGDDGQHAGTGQTTARQKCQQVASGLVGPVQILDDQYDRLPPAHPFEQRDE